MTANPRKRPPPTAKHDMDYWNIDSTTNSLKSLNSLIPILTLMQFVDTSAFFAASARNIFS